ncbi:MAG TPA: fused MFS/spermidine synthase [Candidatus Polarisedimenticolaceae bacterium]|nr:fused MFS/spermidine synthase [Candidatus Polarisedimenticolaceae bacterium]
MRRLAVVPVFALSTFLAAALLFLVEPMVGKMVLPLLGGSASVWTTCMLFFQAGLLAGYAYAHLLGTRLPARAQAAVHLAVVLLAFLALPLSRGVLAPPQGSGAPVAWLLGALTVLVGAPFFALAATGPLLQRWLHGASPARDPYFLYAASNLGSFSGLLLYPLVVERLLPIEGTHGSWSQSRLFSTGFAVFAAVILAAGILARTAGREAPVRTEAPSWRRRGLWVLLAFIPSSAVLGVTQYVTAEIAPVPLLWVVPLAIYLATFVVAFSPRVTIGPWSGLALAVTTASVAACMMPAVRSGGHLLVVVHFAALAAVGLALHGRLAATRPQPGRLTEFYLWIALGGVAGGVFNAAVAPLVFKSIAEYPLALVLAALVRPLWPDDRAEPRRPLSYAFDLVVPLAIAGFAIVARGTETASPVAPGWPAMTVQAIVPALLCLGAAGWRVRFALSLGALLLVGWWQTAAPQASLDRERTFYGVHRVVPSYGPWFRRGDSESPARVEFHMLIHGATRHGLQAVDPDRRRTPTTYYHRSGPLGQAWDALALDGSKEIGIVGLGAGTIAAYGHAGQHFTYFEIDPAVVRIARDPLFFTYLADSAARVDVTVGDGRLSLARTADGAFDVLVLDAFSSDAIPVHLLTREAVDLALRKLAPDGVLLIHLTNHYLRLEEVVDAIARDLHASAFLEGDRTMTDAWTIEGKEPSTWAILARSRERLAPLAADPRWTPMPLPPHPGAKDVLWTDDRSDLFTVLRHF